MSTVAIIEARMTSSRLPGKVLLPLADRPCLQHIIERLKMADNVDQVVVATTTNPEDDAVVDLCLKTETGVFRGSEDDVLKRVYQAARQFKADVVVEITGDCPLIDPYVVEDCVQRFVDTDALFVGNVKAPDYGEKWPLGTAVQVFSMDMLMAAERYGREHKYREHPSLFIRENADPEKQVQIPAPEFLTGGRWTLDYAEDYVMLYKMFEDMRHSNEGICSMIPAHVAWLDHKHINEHCVQKTV